MAGAASTVERIIERLATRRHGGVTRKELLAAGLTREQIDLRVRKGLLIPEFPGVYRVGHRAPSVEAHAMAAVKACGHGAVLSGLSAAHLLGLVTTPPQRPEVTAPTYHRIKGIKTRRSRHIERTWVRGIPVTTPARTLVDCAAELGDAELARACHEAFVRYGVTPEDVEAVLARRPNAPGARRLRRVIHGDSEITLSALERRFLDLLREAGLPLPQTNRRVGSYYVDCRWPEHRLTVEIDSYRFHQSRHAWERDREREREAYARGDDFRRYTPRDVVEAPGRMLTELRALLPHRRQRSIFRS